MLRSVAQVAELLASCGASNAVEMANGVFQIAYYGQRVGLDQEDFVQEAIAQALAGGDVMAAMHRLKNSRRREVEFMDLEPMPELVDAVIPPDPVGRIFIIDECLKRIDRTHRDSKVRKLLKRIIDQCSPIAGEIGPECQQCGGSRSKYAVSLCRPCYENRSRGDNSSSSK